jgi:plastocyanin
LRSGLRVRTLVIVTALAALVLGIAVAQAGGAVKASNYVFKPRTMTIHKGDSVKWKWVNGRHTVTFVKGSFDKSLNANHPKRTRTFKRRGTFKYYCRFHRSLGMKGKVVVK